MFLQQQTKNKGLKMNKHSHSHRKPIVQYTTWLPEQRNKIGIIRNRKEKKMMGLHLFAKPFTSGRVTMH